MDEPSESGTVVSLMEAGARSRQQLLAIALCTVLFFAFLASSALEYLPGVLVFPLLAGLALMGVEPAVPLGWEAHLTRHPLRSPLDSRVRELGAAASWNVGPWILLRRACLIAAIAWLALSGAL